MFRIFSNICKKKNYIWNLKNMQSMIESPPIIKDKDLVNAVKFINKKEVALLVDKINANYEYWSDVKYKKLPEGISSSELWACVKLTRMMQRAFTWPEYNITVSITNKMQRMCHEFDMNFGGSWGVGAVIPNENKEQYLISSLMEEAISSSQMEGASTTRKVAKDMLRKHISPRSKSEQMIFNNYQTIRFVTEHKSEALTPELLLRIHSLMTEKTLDNDEDVGRYRINDEVVVENGITHEVIHTPPPYTVIPSFVEELCRFFNETEARVFIHPIIRGVIIHYMIAYVHPFVDGNGRTARALFYWYMLRRGYWLTEYMSISRIISRSKTAYENSYLYAEADNNDMGYFIAYNLRVLDLAFKDLQQYIKRKIEQKQQTSQFLRLGNINERQAEILKIILDNPQSVLTIKELQNRFNITHTTAKNDMNGLTSFGFLAEIALNKRKKGYIRGDKFSKIEMMFE